MGRSYRLGAPKQNNSLVVTEEIMDSLNDWLLVRKRKGTVTAGNEIQKL
jgi:hypothetical protein